MKCRCGFRTFSSIDMAKHSFSCKEEDLGVAIVNLIHVHPSMSEIDADKCTEDDVSVNDESVQKRRVSIEEEFAVLKVMSE